MQRYNYIKNLKDEDFRLLTGVKKETFNLMLKYLKEAQKKKRQTGFNLYKSSNNKLSIADKLLITLEYLRENRTMFHIGIGYGISKSAVCKTVRWVENVLIKCNEFKLLGKKEMLKDNMEYEVFVIDAIESPIERPATKSKKNVKEKE